MNYPLLKNETFKYTLAVMCLLIVSRTEAQEVKIVKKIKIYKEQVQNDSNYRLTELKSRIPEIIYDLKYATAANFTGRKLYDAGSATYLRLPAATALASVQKKLHSLGFGLKIFDAYRPYSATRLMWDLIKDERYVANPAKGSNHNRGLAVDLTVVHLVSGEELDMGTGFDNFTDTAHHAFTALPEPVLANRRLLRQVMEEAGYKALATEWWHYSWPNDRSYEVLDISFKKLRSLN
jgi:zinc D-Ala-D-Ala dipeptidase